MITYANESLFYQDNIEKQITISFTGGSITNSELRAEEFEIEETLNTGDDINFGECNANKVSFVVGYYPNSIAGKTITVSMTPSGGSAFQLGVYKVLSDYSRFKIVYTLLDRELSVNEIMAEVGLSQTATSYQLKILRANHLVKYVRKGQKVLYRIDDEHVAQTIKIAMEHISHN